MADHVAVMTLWTKPDRWRHEGAEELWSRSVQLLRRLADAGHFDGLWLVTDRKGMEWAKSLQLPFEGIHEWLENNGKVGGLEQAWSSGKLATYTMMTTPFVHIDNDVLLKRPLPPHLLAADFLVERAERWCPCGPDLADWKLPKHWQAAADRCARLSWSFGLLGGRAHSELGAAAETALGVLRANQAILGRDGSWATVFAEQWGMARDLDPWRVATLLPPGQIANEAAGPHFRHLQDRMKYEPEWQRKVLRALDEEWPGQAARCRDVAKTFTP